MATVLGFMTGSIAPARALSIEEQRFLQQYSLAVQTSDTGRMRELARQLHPSELYQITDTLVEETLYERCRGGDDRLLDRVTRSLADQYATLHQKRAMTLHVETMLSLQRPKCADYLKARDLWRAGGRALDDEKYAEAESNLLQTLSIAQRLNNTELQLHALNALFNIEDSRGNARASIDYITKSLALMKEVADHWAPFAVTCNAGNAYAKSNDYITALHHYERCLGIIQNDPMRDRVLFAPYRGMIEVYGALGRRGEARDTWARLLKLRQGSDDRGFFDRAIRLASTVGLHGDTELAMEIVDSLRSTADSKSFSKKERLVVLVGLAGAYQGLQASQSAKQYSELAISLAKEVNDNHLFAMASLVLAYANIALNQPDEALLHVKESYRRNANAPASYVTIDTIRLLADLHEQMGQFDQWRRYVEEAYERATRANLVQESANVALEIASLSLDMGMFKQADDFVDRALAAGSAAGIHQARAHALRARIRQNQERFDEALSEYSHAIRLQQQASLAHDKAVTSLNMASVYLDLQDTVRARALIASLDQCLLVRCGAELSKALQTLHARIKYLEGGVEESIADFSTVYEYQKALAYRERYSLSDRPSRWQAEFRANGQAYADMLMAAAQSGKGATYAQRAFFVSDHGKSINFQKAVSRHLASTVRNLDSDTRATVDKVNALLIQKDGVEKKVREYSGLSNPKHDQQLADIDRQLIDLSKTLGAKLPAYQTPFIELTNLEQIQRRLRIDEAIVSYSVRYARGTAFVVTKSKLAYEPISISREELRKSVEGVLRGVRNVTELEDLRRFSPNSSYELYRLLFQPLQPHLQGIKKITIVADDILYTFPFEMLVVSPPQRAQARKGAGNPYLSEFSNIKYLVDEYALTYLPSVSSFVATREHRRSALWLKTLVAFGDPVFDQLNQTLRTVHIEVVKAESSTTSKPTFTTYRKRDKDLAFGRLKHSGKEVQAIAEITSARPSDIYVGERAREENVYRAQLEDARYMLFATHAVMPSEENGIQEPALALVPTTIGSFGATGADADGLLTASEVMNLKLSAELVVLSACNTAGSTMHGAGEGFVGLTRAFMFAGAKNLLVSHWPVESDSTRRLMVEVLRRNVKEQQRGDHALTEAKKWLRTLVVEHPEHASGKMSLSHPFFWAPFVWVGGY